MCPCCCVWGVAGVAGRIGQSCMSWQGTASRSGPPRRAHHATTFVVPGNAFKQLLDILIGLLARGPLIFFPAMDPDTPIRAEPQPSVLRWILGFLMGLSHLTICVGRVSD